MIKVIHFVPSLSIASGVATTIMNYYRIIDRNKIQFDFICFGIDKTETYINEITSLGGKVYFVCRPTKFLCFYKQMKNIILNYSSNHIIFHNHQIAFTIFLKPMLSKFKAYNFITHNHMTKYSDKILSTIRNKLLCLPIKHMKNIYYFACSIDAGKMMYGKKDFFIMKNGIDCDKFKYSKIKRLKIRKELGVDDNCFVIGHVGRLEPVKNHTLILDIFKSFNDIYPKSKLLLIGKGRLENNIKNKIKSMNLSDKVLMLGVKNNIDEMLSAMDLFLFPSFFEGLGIAIIEAQSCGLPVVVSNMIPKEAIIKNVSIVNLNEGIDKWIDQINKLKNLHINRSKVNIYVKNSDFNIYINTEALINIYNNIINKGIDKR